MDPNNIIIVAGTIIFGSSGFWALVTLLVQRKFSKKDAKSESIKRLEEEDKKIKSALLAILHDRLYQGTKFFLKQNKISPAALQNLEYIHNAYAEFGGNSTGTELFERCKKLPLVDDMGEPQSPSRNVEDKA